MLRKIIILLTIITTFICATKKSTGSFGKGKKESVDSLYIRDIREVKKNYPEIKVIEYEQEGKGKSDQSEYIQQQTVQINYPIYARDNGIQGIVYGRFIVDTLGIGKDFKIIKGIGGGCDEEVLRAMKVLATFPIKVPTNASGRKIEMYIKIAQKFKLM